MRTQREVLENRFDAEVTRNRGATHGDVFTHETDLALLHFLGPGHDLDQRAFSGAVVTDQCRDLTRLDIEITPIERDHLPVGSNDASCL